VCFEKKNLYGRQNLEWGCFGIFFSKDPSKLKKIYFEVGILTTKSPPGYVPDLRAWFLGYTRWVYPRNLTQDIN